MYSNYAYMYTVIDSILCVCVFMYNVVYKRVNKTLVLIHALSHYHPYL